MSSNSPHYRHIVLFNWKEGMPPSHIAAVTKALSELPSKIPQILTYRFGSNLGINAGNYDYCVTADFASIEDYIIYRDHLDHKAFIAEFTAPFVETRAAIQFALTQ